MMYPGGMGEGYIHTYIPDMCVCMCVCVTKIQKTVTSLTMTLDLSRIKTMNKRIHVTRGDQNHLFFIFAWQSNEFWFPGHRLDPRQKI